jgi:hypothetical protein
VSLAKDNIAARKDQWIEESAQALVQLLTEHFASSRDGLAYKKATLICMTHLCRPGWPGFYLSKVEKVEATKEIEGLSRSLYYAHDKNALVLFSKGAARAIVNRVPTTRYINLDKKFKGQGNPHFKKLSAIVKAELLASQDNASAVLRAATRIFQEEKRHKRNSFYVENASNDLLSAVLSLPKTQRAELPKQDLRAHILRCDSTKQLSEQGTPLVELLRQAAPFLPRLMCEALGEELYARCKPVGYADRFGKVLLVEVDSSSSAHEMSFRKNEILARLKKVKGLETISDIRFKAQVPG